MNEIAPMDIAMPRVRKRQGRRAFGTASLGLLLAVVVHTPQGQRAEAHDYDAIGKVFRFYGTAWSGSRENYMKFAFLGNGQDTPAVWEGRPVTILQSVWPEFDGQWYIKGTPLHEHWELWDTPTFDGTQAVAAPGHTNVSDDTGAGLLERSALLIDAHVGFDPTVDTARIWPPEDPRPEVGYLQHMYHDRPDAGSGRGNLEVKIVTHRIDETVITPPDLFHGRRLEMVENAWPDINRIWYLKFVQAAGVDSGWYELMEDAALSIHGVPEDSSALYNEYGGNIGPGYLSAATIAGKFVEPVPEPATWMLLSVGGLAFVARRPQRPRVESTPREHGALRSARPPHDLLWPDALRCIDALRFGVLGRLDRVHVERAAGIQVG